MKYWTAQIEDQEPLDLEEETIDGAREFVEELLAEYGASGEHKVDFICFDEDGCELLRVIKKITPLGYYDFKNERLTKSDLGIS